MNINALISKAQKGDREAMDKILHLYTPFVKKIVRYYSIVLSREDKEDLFIEGLMGLYRSVNSFNSGKKKRFEDFAYISVKNAIFDYLRRRKSKGVDTMFPSFYFPSGSDIEEESILLKQDLEELSKELSSFERDVFSLFVKGYKIKEIADKLGKPYKSIDNALQRIKRHLRSYYFSS